MDHPVFDKVYRVDRVTVEKSHAEEEAESQLVELEQRVSRSEPPLRVLTAKAPNV